MKESRTVGFRDGMVTLSAEDYLAVHAENFRLRQRNLELQTALDAIKGITERAEHGLGSCKKKLRQILALYCAKSDILNPGKPPESISKTSGIREY